MTRFDQIARERADYLNRYPYYVRELQRLLQSLVVPNSDVLEVGSGLGDLISSLQPRRGVGIDISSVMTDLARQRHPEIDFVNLDVESDPLPSGKFDYIILTDVVGLLGDIQSTIESLREVLKPGGKLIVTYYNFIWEPALRVAELVGLKTKWPDQSWLSMEDISNLLQLADFEIVRQGTDVLVPVNIPLISTVFNRVGAKLPLLSHLSLVSYFVASESAPKVVTESSVSVVCPCRNEKGNIRDAILRTPVMGRRTELIFVDGNSTDGTVEEIEACMAEYKGPLTLKLIHQGDGKGKGDAVRKGYAAAENEILMILDSDLTVPPEELPKFYRALIHGKGQFINGVRLVYPMEGEAMRFLNLLGNKFFSVVLSWLLEQPIKDSLCGTKVLRKTDYDRIAANRAYFGEFDPFGDFDLLFGAARLNLKIVDLPIRYRARTYGDTKISRFAHGWLLLKMSAFGFRKLRLGA
ncbi:MAG: bifunctional class I SAM-dependent methyltransferase/glycosyltransferase family 2 protein [Polyangiaceae bacterium]|nr:bifunctional class I SAM-dependent methyltransferase/glycosyltransferase family 2 protein [Polyangiaceae bacterium]